MPASPVSPASPPPLRRRLPLRRTHGPARTTARRSGRVRRPERRTRPGPCLVVRAGRSPTSVLISSIGGMAGIGKTTLAVHWAHEMTDLFPDGQLYVNLRGFDPTGSLVTPDEAVRTFLGALGVPPSRIPAGLDAQTALYRSMLAQRRMLVLLDNARDTDQVRPLLPGSPAAWSSSPAATSSPAWSSAKGRIRCPWASCRTPRHTASSRTVSGPTGRRRNRRRRRRSSPGARGCRWRWPSSPPMPSPTPASRSVPSPRNCATATAASTPSPRATTSPPMYGPSSPGRTRRCPLRPRACSGCWACTPDPTSPHPPRRPSPGSPCGRPGDCSSSSPAPTCSPNASPAATPCTTCCVSTPPNASRPRRHSRSASDPWGDCTPGICTPPPPPTRTSLRSVAGLTWNRHTDLCRPLQFTTHDQALDWCETERANLVAAVHQAAGSGRPSIAWQLPAVLWGFFYLRSHTHDWVDTARAGLAAARAHEDRRGEAQALADLAAALRASGRFDEAADHLRRAMVAYRDLGDADGRRSAVSNLGTCTSSPASSARRSSTSAADWPSDTSSATPGRRGSASATWATPTSASTGSTRRSSAWSSRWTSCARTATAGSRASPSTSSVRPIAASIATTTPSAITTRPSRRTGTSATGGERATRWATWATPNWPPTSRRPLATAGGRHWRSSWSSTTGTRRRSVNAFAGWVTTTARPRPRGSGDTAGPHPYDGWEVTGVQLPGQLASW